LGLADPMARGVALGLAVAPGHGNVRWVDAGYHWLLIFARLYWLGLEVCVVVSLLNLIGTPYSLIESVIESVLRCYDHLLGAYLEH